MGVNVELRGSPPSSGRAPVTVLDTVPDPDDLFVDLLHTVRGSGHTPTLDRIDPYGDLALTAPEVPAFITELSVLRRHAHSDEAAVQLAAIAALAGRCLDHGDPCHLFFLGD